MPSPSSTRWCFTLNNPTEPERVTLAQAGIENAAQQIVYLIVGREVGAEGTPHLQGFVIFEKPIRRSTVKIRLGSERFHLEPARGTSQQASDYCKKEKDFDEYGEFPNKQGKRSDIDRFNDWLNELDSPPDRITLSALFPALFLRYNKSLMEMVRLRFPRQPIFDINSVELREWQRELDDALNEDPDDRKIHWYTDESGGAGKSWMATYLYSKYPHCQLVKAGKLEDMAHTLDTHSSIFVFDIPRSRTEYFQYSILEQLKDGFVFSPKYDSHMKVWPKNVHVICFANEHPDLDKLSLDRWITHQI